MLYPNNSGGVQGYDKHFGRALCYITINRNVYWWKRLTFNSSIQLRENTDPCSPMKQYQVMREEPMTVELEGMIPGNTNAEAAAYLSDFRPGQVVYQFNVSLLNQSGVSIIGGTVEANVNSIRGNNYTTLTTLAGTSRFGTAIVKSSNVDVSKDDLASMRVTLQFQGYGDDTAIQSDSGAYAYADDFATAYPDSVDYSDLLPRQIGPTDN